jgi:Fe2+ or Zn2+ uptake regulation protein
MDHVIIEHRRLAILRHLEASARHTSNAAILTDVVTGVGIPSTRDQVMTALSWLEEQGLVSTVRAETFWVASATARGVEVATGHAVVPGVKRPSSRV